MQYVDFKERMASWYFDYKAGVVFGSREKELLIQDFWF